MKRQKPLQISLRTLAIVFSLFFCSCKEVPTKLLIAGDSWSAFLCYYDSFEKAFALKAIQNLSVHDNCIKTTRFGIRAENWRTSKYHKNVLQYLANPEAKVLYLSLGGNDFINYWKRNLSPEAELKIFAHIVAEVKETTDMYLRLRPGLFIIVSGYDFPRFTPHHIVPAYREAFERMGSPTPFELNSTLVRFSNEMAKVADNRNVFYIQHYGLMQYYFGAEPENEGFAAIKKTIPPPSEISPATQSTRVGGDLRSQSPESGFLKFGFLKMAVVDAFHLSRFGYDKIAEHTVENFLKTWDSSQ